MVVAAAGFRESKTETDMNTKSVMFLLVALVFALFSAPVMAADPAGARLWASADAGSLLASVALIAIYGASGIFLLFGAYKLWDKLTPGDLGDIIFIKGNVAAAILAGFVLLSVSIVIAAAIVG